MNVLVIDIGGSHVKLLASDKREPRRFDSGPDLSPTQMVEQVVELASDWDYDAISIGYPGLVDRQGPAQEPGNLGKGWVGFDFQAAFDKPVHVINDAAMQALGAYEGDKMLFLGLGTGLGSALVSERVVVSLELGSLPFERGQTMAQRLGDEALQCDGKHPWQNAVKRAVEILRPAMAADYVVLGGGNAAQIDALPPHVRLGHNNDAFTGGFRLWEEPVELHESRPGCAWRVVG